MTLVTRIGGLSGLVLLAIAAAACSVNSVPPATKGDVDAGKDGGGPVIDPDAGAGADASNVCVFGSSTFGNCVFGP